MSRYLFLFLLLIGYAAAASAQPGPNDPPQIDLELTLSTSQGSISLHFGLDVRASDGFDDMLHEDKAMPPWTFAMEARFVRPGDASHTLRDYRYGAGADKTVEHTFEFQKGQDDNDPLTIAWNLPPYATGVMQDVITGSIINKVMSGSGSVQVADDGSGDPIVPKLKMTINYVDIPGGILPVELTAFEALVDGGDVVLAWETASETNNAGFEVQQQIGASFQSVGYVAGHGTTTDPQSYSYRIANMAAGSHSFRLKQIDFDGTFAYSEVVTAELALAGAFEFAPAAPNPFNPQTQFTLTVARGQHVRLAVYDMLGRHVALLHDGNLEAQEAHLFRFDASNLPSGRYFIHAQGEYFASSQTVVLLK